MRRNPKRPQPPLLPGQGCVFPGCPDLAKRGWLMCSKDWGRVPRNLKDDLRAAKADGVDTAAYTAAVAAITAWAQARAAREQTTAARSGESAAARRSTPPHGVAGRVPVLHDAPGRSDAHNATRGVSR